MKNASATFEVYKGTQFVGFVKAFSHAQAVARAHGRYGICDVELPTEAAKERRDYLSANACQQGKQSRRYPTPGFDARCDALIAEFKATR